MKTDGIITIGVLLLILWLAVSKVEGESRLSRLLKSLGIGGATAPNPDTKPHSLATKAVQGFSDAVTVGEAEGAGAPITRAPSMVYPGLQGGIPPDSSEVMYPELSGGIPNDWASNWESLFGMVTAVNPHSSTMN